MWLTPLARLLWLGLVPASLVFALAPMNGAPAPGGDKFGHILGFFCLMLASRLAFSRPATLAQAGGLVLYGLCIELVQGVLPYRSMELADLAADTLGIGLGILAWHLLTLKRGNHRALVSG